MLLSSSLSHITFDFTRTCLFDVFCFVLPARIFDRAHLFSHLALDLDLDLSRDVDGAALDPWGCILIWWFTSFF